MGHAEAAPGFRTDKLTRAKAHAAQEYLRSHAVEFVGSDPALPAPRARSGISLPVNAVKEMRCRSHRILTSGSFGQPAKRTFGERMSFNELFPTGAGVPRSNSHFSINSRQQGPTT